MIDPRPLAEATGAPDRVSSVHDRLRTPRAAALAGIAFSVLLIGSGWLLWSSIPDDPGDAADVIRNSRRITLALDLLPFAGIAFLWFVGVLRDRMGEREDRFFATIFLGSGLLFIAMLFVGAAVAGGLIRILGEAPGPIIQSRAYALGRLQIHLTIQVYALKMAAVFMMSTATICLRTRIVPRWMAVLGYALALLLILQTSRTGHWITLAFPLWVLLISAFILVDNLRSASGNRP